MVLNNPKQTVKTLIIQNNNLKTAIKNVKPQYTIGKELIYKYTNETAFWASNEFRFFRNQRCERCQCGSAIYRFEKHIP